jgi:hypothetical protein
MGLVDDAISAMTRAYRADPTSPLTLAVLGSWHLSRTVLESADLDTALNLLYSAIDHLLELDCENLSASYASLVCEEVFEALWQRGRCREAREIARMAGQRDWITAHMLNTLNEADHGSGIKVTSFSVTARAEAGERPEHWPADAHGYTTGLTVLATDEDEARRYSLEYLRSLDPFPNIHFQIELILPEDLGEITPAGPTMEPRARGVVGVNIGRAYFRT